MADTSRPFALRRLGAPLAGLLTASVVAVGSLAAAPAAHANVTSFTASAYSVAAGSQISLVAGSNSAMMGASVTFTADGTTLGTVPVVNGQAALLWTPAYAGTYNVVASDGMTSSAITVTATASGTTTQITTPATAQIGVAIPVSVTVTSNSPSTVRPSGTVTFYQSNGTALQTVGLQNSANPAQSVASFTWTPTTAGSYSFYAIYTPAAGVAATGSQSPLDNILVSATGQNIWINMPPTVKANAPTNLVANVTAGITGNVVFSVNGAQIGTVPLVNGVAMMGWTPTAVGATTITAQLFSSNPAQNVAVQDVISVTGASQPDVITVIGQSGKPWLPDVALLMQNGQTAVGTVSTLSGATPTFSVTGPCTVTSSAITAISGAGTCRIAVSSPGGNGYSPAAIGYTVDLTPGTQVATVTPRKSGTVKKGSRILLEQAGKSDTNAGQNMRWAVRSGGKSCRIQVAQDGSVRLRMTGSGTCKVRGVAPAVPGEWNALTINRTYKVK